MPAFTKKTAIYRTGSSNPYLTKPIPFFSPRDARSPELHHRRSTDGRRCGAAWGPAGDPAPGAPQGLRTVPVLGFGESDTRETRRLGQESPTLRLKTGFFLQDFPQPKSVIEGNSHHIAVSILWVIFPPSFSPYHSFFSLPSFPLIRNYREMPLLYSQRLFPSPKYRQCTISCFFFQRSGPHFFLQGWLNCFARLPRIFYTPSHQVLRKIFRSHYELFCPFPGLKKSNVVLNQFPLSSGRVQSGAVFNQGPSTSILFIRRGFLYINNRDTSSLKNMWMPAGRRIKILARFGLLTVYHSGCVLRHVMLKGPENPTIWTFIPYSRNRHTDVIGVCPLSLGFQWGSTWLFFCWVRQRKRFYFRSRNYVSWKFR